MQAEHLYVHVPFCARRCVYCDFSIAVRPAVPVADYVEGIRRELHGRHRDSVFDLDTLYLGGGTPSKLGGDGIARLIELISATAAPRANAEVTVEANPEDVSASNVRAWRAAGVNRVSLGVQSFNEGVLSWMHRTHDVEQAVRSVEVLREGAIHNISIDLIFATPASIGRDWRRDVEQALALEVPHISVYGLTVEPHTPLGRQVARKVAREAPEESFEAQFLDAHSMLTSAGLEHYEVSNYGRRGLHSRHNTAYWLRRPYGGLGPSAHEFDGRLRSWNVQPYVAWLERVLSTGAGVEGVEEITGEQAHDEELYLGLRTNRGARITGTQRTAVQPWIEARWARLDSDVLTLTPTGWLRLDAIASALTPARSR